MSEIEGAVNAEYSRMLDEYITSINKDRVMALAKAKVYAQQCNELMQVNRELNKTLVAAQQQIGHKTKELEKLKKRKNAKSKDISE
jgi:hypothetical protein